MDQWLFGLSTLFSALVTVLGVFLYFVGPDNKHARRAEFLVIALGALGTIISILAGLRVLEQSDESGRELASMRAEVAAARGKTNTLESQLSPRLLSDDRFRELVKALKGILNEVPVQVGLDGSDEETKAFFLQVVLAFSYSGWEVDFSSEVEPQPGTLPVNNVGVITAPALPRGSAALVARDAVQKVLKDFGVSISSSARVNSTVPKGAIRVVVGPKDTINVQNK